MNYTSYEEYVDHLVSMIPPEVDDDFSSVLKEHLMPIAEKHWTDYLIGQRENYLVSEDDMEEAWQKTTMHMVEISLMKLSDMGLVETGINNDGEIVYRISSDGEEYIKNLDKE